MKRTQDDSNKDRSECPICMNSMIGKSIFLCKGGHSFCGDCNMKMKECPFCSQELTQVRNYALEATLAPPPVVLKTTTNTATTTTTTTTTTSTMEPQNLIVVDKPDIQIYCPCCQKDLTVPDASFLELHFEEAHMSIDNKYLRLVDVSDFQTIQSKSGWITKFFSLERTTFLTPDISVAWTSTYIYNPFRNQWLELEALVSNGTFYFQLKRAKVKITKNNMSDQLQTGTTIQVSAKHFNKERDVVQSIEWHGEILHPDYTSIREEYDKDKAITFPTLSIPYFQLKDLLPMKILIEITK